MKAILNKVLVEPKKTENVNQFGFEMGDQESEKFATGIVKSIGDKVDNIKEGQLAWYDKNRASDVLINGERFVVMDNFNIFVVEDI